MKKVLFVIGSLQVGGAETVMVDLVNNIYKEFDITVLLIEKRGELLNTINPEIKLKYITKSKEFCNNFISAIYNKVKLSLLYRYLSKKKWYINRIYNKILKENYDTEISFLAGIPGDIVSQSPNKFSKKIAWIHSCVNKDNPRLYNKYLTYTKNFNTIVAVSQGSMEKFKETYPQCSSNIVLIHNFIDTNKIMNKANLKCNIVFAKNKLNCLSLGRLSPEKGFDRIINIAKKYEDTIDFYIGGFGPQKDELENEIKTKNIKNVFLLGLLENPYPYLKNADFFLLSSRSEAYPTVVIEAMVLNKFIIATDVAGVKEILEEYDNKIIVKNEDSAIPIGLDQYLNIKEKKSISNANFEKRNKTNLQKIKELISQ